MPSGDDEVDTIADGLFEWFVNKSIEWALGSFDTLLTWWMSDAYRVSMDGEDGGVLFFVREHTNVLTLILGFAMGLVAAFRVAIQRKGEPFRVALSQFFELVVVVLILATVVNLLIIAGDEYSDWIIGDARRNNGAWKENWKSGFGRLEATETMFILLFFALVAAIASVVQFALMLFRSGMLIILVGVLPVLAAARFSEYGNNAYKKAVGLTLSFILYKPLTATIYAVALELLKSRHEADRLFGLAIVGGSIFAFPAVLRSVMPAVAGDNASFGVRQVGHSVFGSSSLAAGRTMLRAGRFLTGRNNNNN